MSNLSVLVAFIVTLMASARAPAETVSLEWRPGVQVVHEDDPVTLALYAVSDGADQGIAGLDAILRWNPGVIALTGLINNGPYPWFLSYFPGDAPLDGLNDTWLDGDAFYVAIGQLTPNPPAVATSSGLLVTTITFQAEAPGTTSLTLLPEYGLFTSTRVLDAVTPGVLLTGTLGGATVVVAGCGVSSDVDGDCDVDLDDFLGFDDCMEGPDAAGAAPGCEEHNHDAPAAIELRDFADAARNFTGDMSE